VVAWLVQELSQGRVEEHRLSVDVVPDISVRDEAALASQLTDEIKALVPGEDVTILIDHNYSE